MKSKNIMGNFKQITKQFLQKVHGKNKILVTDKREHIQKFFKAGEVSQCKASSINIPSIIHEGEAFQGKMTDIFLVYTFKTAF